MTDRLCESCGAAFTLPDGRGAKPRFCRDCRRYRSAVSTSMRHQRRSLTILAELVDTFGGVMARRRAGDVARCDTCGAPCPTCQGGPT